MSCRGSETKIDRASAPLGLRLCPVQREDVARFSAEPTTAAPCSAGGGKRAGKYRY